MAVKEANKQEVRPEITKLRQEADSLIAAFHMELGATSQQTYFRLKGLLANMNRLGDVNLRPFEVEIENRIVIQINDTANKMGVGYRIVKEKGVFELVSEKVVKKNALLSNERDKVQADSVGDQQKNQSETLRQLAKKGPTEKQLPPPKPDDDDADEPAAEEDSRKPPDLPRATRG
jgi:hypothetical protein